METFCACAWPCAVNKSEERYHCDRCGYPLGPQDRRQAILKVVGQQVWGMLVYQAQGGYRRPERAWDYLECQLGPWLARTQPPPLRHIQVRFSPMHFPELFDPERE